MQDAISSATTADAGRRGGTHNSEMSLDNYHRCPKYFDTVASLNTRYAMNELPMWSFWNSVINFPDMFR